METVTIIELYILFSLTTAIVGLIQIYAPVQRRIKEKHINNLATLPPIKSYLIFVFYGFVTSPLLFGVLMMPSVTSRFIDAMYESLTS